MREMLEEKLARFTELEGMMMDPEVLGNSSKLAAVAREHGGLAKLAGLYRNFKNVVAELGELKEMAASDDAEEQELAEMEIPGVTERREGFWAELLDMTIGGEDATRTRCVMEIRAGTGGDEAALFARDLYEMYKRHSEIKGWKVEVMEASPTELGGFKEITLTFEGDGVFRELGYESGGHRVQRVPDTETKGRVHTSLQQPLPYCPNQKILKSILNPMTIEKTYSMRAVRADSTLTKQPPQCESHITKPGS